MSLKCRDCINCIEKDSILFPYYCCVNKEYVFGRSSACQSFESIDYTCKDCGYYRDGGRCAFHASFFGLIGGGKHHPDKHACWGFKKKYF